jgi:hypothetical protein
LRGGAYFPSSAGEDDMASSKFQRNPIYNLISPLWNSIGKYGELQFTHPFSSEIGARELRTALRKSLIVL